MKKIMIFVSLMCVFALGLNTQAESQSLSSFMPEKTGFITYTTVQYGDYWKPKSNDTLVYYVGGPLTWSAQNVKVSPTESVFDIVCREIPGTGGKSYKWIFADADIIRTLIDQFEKDVVPLKGEVRTAGINKKTGLIERFSRPARDNDIPFNIDWNVLEQLPFDPPINLGANVDPVPVVLSGCGNPYYAPSVGGGYKLGPPIVYNRNNEGYAQVAPSTGGEKYAEPEYVAQKSDAGNTYIENNYYDQDEVSYDQDDRGQYEDPRVRFLFSLNLSAGPLYGNDCCGYGGHSYGYCNHNVPYQQFGYQPSGGGTPQVTNVNIVNEIYNSNTNTNTNTNTTTVTTHPGNPPTNPGGPVDPPNGGNGDGQPLDPPNGRNAGKNNFNNRGNFASRSNPNGSQGSTNYSRPKTNPSTATVDSRPSNSSKPQPNQFTRPVSRPNDVQANSTQQSRPKENRGNNNQSSPRSNYQTGKQPRQTPSSRQSYGNSGPSRQLAYNQPTSNRGSAPTGGRGNFGGGNSGGRRR